MPVNTNYYKKSGILLMNIARDFFAMKSGDRIGTILEYTEKFSVSRGVVQNAIATLEKENCIRIEKKGVKGTYLTHIDYRKLYSYTNWGSVTGTMPIPLNPFLSSLTTAICDQMDLAPFPCSLAYITGSEKRLETLENLMYDFIVVSKSSAQIYLEKNNCLTASMELDACIYSTEHVLYFFDPEKKEIEDGMRVGIDYNSLDQAVITKRLCEGKDVRYVPFPYTSFGDLVKEHKVDCVVYRLLDWCDHGDTKFNIVHLQDIKGYTKAETNTPVILTNKNNYGIDRLLKQYLDNETMGEIQKEVLSGRRAARFY